MKITECTYERHGAAILEILNEAILNTTAQYDYSPRSSDDLFRWFEEKRQRGYPVIGVMGDQGELLGFATYGPFRVQTAFKYTVEHSVYVHRSGRRRGVGRMLMERLIMLAQEQDLHVLIGAIDAENDESIRFHERLGFIASGSLPQVAFKFGRWLDLQLYQLVLRTPAEPKDG